MLIPDSVCTGASETEMYISVEALYRKRYTVRYKGNSMICAIYVLQYVPKKYTKWCLPTKTKPLSLVVSDCHAKGTCELGYT